MSIDLPLERMTLAEKLETMERLWADISKAPAEVLSPAWHKEILEERRRLVAEGKLRFLDLDSAITELKDQLRGNSSS